MCDDLLFAGSYKRASMCQKNLLNNYRNKDSGYYRLQFALAYSYLKIENYSECLEYLKSVYENRDSLKEEYEVMNHYEKLGEKNGKLSMITDMELKMLTEISEFLKDKDQQLYQFYHEALMTRQKVIASFKE